jgi:rubrerythrin
MVPVEALKIALREEVKAIALYRKMEKEHPSLQETFSFLITEEEKHQKLLAQKIEELTRI